MSLELSKMTMAAFAEMLTTYLDRPVLDETGLKGNYTIALDIPLEALMSMVQNIARTAGLPLPPGGIGGGRGGIAGPGGTDAAGTAALPEASTAPIFQSVQKLGLKLEAKKAPLDTIVVDRIEKTPTDN
jgi:uncharacterized protein (TIGR03435 family)